MLRRRHGVCLPSVLLLLALPSCSWLGPSPGAPKSEQAAKALDPGDVLVAEATSPFQHLQIELHPRKLGHGAREWSLRLVSGGLIQSEILVESGDPKNIRIKEPFTSGAKYIELLFLPWLFTPDAKNVLMVGGGGGVIPTLLRHGGSELKIDVVEIDPTVVRLAERYFGYRANEGGTATHVMDGRAYVRDCVAKYDIILLDAFAGRDSPPQLVTREFFQLVKSRLSERGVVDLNLISALDGPDGQFYRSVLKTVLAVFGPERVYVFPKWYDPRWGHTPESARRRHVTNIQILATAFDTSPNPLPRDELVRRAERLAASGRFPVPSLPVHAGNYLPDEVKRDLSAEPLLTDPRPVPAAGGPR